MNQQQTQNPESGIDPLEEYGLNLTVLAKAGKIDPVIGREDEIRRIIQILSRRKKNNPVLIGEPGTGKTTVVEGMAKRIIEGDVPENIKGKQLIAMDLPAMVAGAMYKGQFEERLKNFIKAVKEKNGDIIVFIDEIHMIVGVGGQGQMDVANIIKPELAHGTLKVIGATTLNEYQKYVEPMAFSAPCQSEQESHYCLDNYQPELCGGALHLAKSDFFILPRAVPLTKMAIKYAGRTLLGAPSIRNHRE